MPRPRCRRCPGAEPRPQIGLTERLFELVQEILDLVEGELVAGDRDQLAHVLEVFRPAREQLRDDEVLARDHGHLERPHAVSRGALDEQLLETGTGDHDVHRDPTPCVNERDHPRRADERRIVEARDKPGAPEPLDELGRSELTEIDRQIEIGGRAGMSVHGDRLGAEHVPPKPHRAGRPRERHERVERGRWCRPSAPCGRALPRPARASGGLLHGSPHPPSWNRRRASRAPARLSLESRPARRRDARASTGAWRHEPGPRPCRRSRARVGDRCAARS